SNPTIATADIDDWLELSQRDNKTMAQGSPFFLTAEVCENGHLTTSAVERQAERLAKFCPQCGAATLRACLKCEAAIQRQDARPVITNAFYQPPNHCHACGAEFPWKIAKLHAAKEHAAEIEGLDEQEKQQLPGIIDDLASGGPRTELAADRFKRIMK